MTIPDTSRPSRMGVHRIGYVFEDAGIIFREISVTDIGIDAEIELARNGISLGKLARIQIKSGDSFVNHSTKAYTFKARISSFQYWQRFCLPVIGIVYSPSSQTGVWFDLSRISQDIPTNDESYQVTQKLNADNEFNVENALKIANLVEKHFEAPIRSYAEKVEQAQIKVNPETERAMSKEETWKYLISVFLSSTSAPDVLADAGYRISWYFPAVDQELRIFFKNRIREVSDKELINIVRGVHDTLEKNRDDVSALICDLVSYLPYKVRRLKALAKSGIVPKEYLEALFQIIEYFTQEFEESFRSNVLSQYASKKSEI